MPTISVLIPTHNCATFLPAAVESALAQTYKDLEVIVVDDGSTDETEAVLAPYLDRITYIKQKNAGVCVARNTAVCAAKGEFIAWLDADDSWKPDKLERQMPKFSDSSVGIVYSDFETLHSDGYFRDSFLRNHPCVCEGSVFEQYVQSRFFLPSTVVMRSKCFADTGLFDEEMRCSGDVELFTRICLRWRVALVNEVLTLRNEGSYNITADKKRVGTYMVLALNKLLAKAPDLSRSQRRAVYNELGKQHWHLGYDAFIAGEMTEARRNLRKVVRYSRSRSRACVLLIALSYMPLGANASLRKAKARIQRNRQRSPAQRNSKAIA